MSGRLRLGIVRLFQRPAAAPAAPVETPAPDVNDALVAARLEPMMRQLEDDVMLTMRVIGYKAERAKDRIADSIGLVEEIGRASDDLAEIAAAAKQATAALALTTQRLDAATQSIERHTAGADLFVAEARQLTEDVTASTERMNEAVEKITGVVQLITTIARRTNLLALNAGIEAARAGPAGRGFSVIAGEMKTLAQQVNQATGDVTSQTTNLQIAARQNSDFAKRIGNLLGRIEPVFGAIRGAVDGQAAQTREVSGHAASSENFVGYVAGKATAVKAIASSAVKACYEAGAASDDTNLSLHRMTQRAMVFLRHSASGNRRRHERVPVRIPAFLNVDGVTRPTTVLDLSVGGVLLMPDGGGLSQGVSGRLRIPAIGAMPARVVAESELGLHVRFQDVEADAIARIERTCLEAKARYEPLIERVKAAARDVSEAFEDGLATAEVTMDELITTEYRPIDGTNPVQYDTAALAFYERVLPPILDEHRSGDPTPLFVLPQDRNAFCPVHHPELSKPQRAGMVDWNDLNSRNRRLLDRWQTLIGARNANPHNIRVYIRHQPDGAAIPILMISCPVFLKGALWGNVQMGFHF